MRKQNSTMRTSIYLLLLALCLGLWHVDTYAQTIVHGRADTMIVVDFATILAAPDTNIYIHEADDEESMGLPHNMTMPPKSTIMKEDPNVPNFNGQNPNTPAPQSPAPSTSFIGLVDNITTIPPDVNGAAGPNHLMITLNSQVRISSKTGTTTSTVSLNTFWTAGGLHIADSFDPKILYDPYSNRWIVVAFADPETDSSSMVVAVSRTSDPTAQWYFYKIDADAAGTNWMDYPSIGFNKKWIVVNGNMYSVASNAWKGTKVFMLDKNDFYTGGTGNYSVVYNTAIGGTLAPATTYDSSLATEYLMQSWDGTAGNIRLYSVTGAVGSETFAPVTYINTTNHWGSSGASGWDIAPQLGSTHKIANNDDRMQKLVYRNGSLWCVHNAFFPSASPTRCSVQWWQVSTAGTVLQRGLIDDPTGTKYYAFPSIAVNSADEALIGYSSFSSGQYASADYSYRTTCDAVNTLESDYIYKAGEASYYKTYGGSNNRWGDYTGTCVDPTNDLDMWTLQEYATTASGGYDRWSTYWAKVAHVADGGTGTWTWTGTVSTDWFNRCNWDKGTLPDIQSDVVIPGGTPNNPTITGSTANCNTLTINDTAGAVLTINSTASGAINVAQ